MKPSKFYLEFDFVKKSLAILLSDKDDKKYLLKDSDILFRLNVCLANFVNSLDIDNDNLIELNIDEKDFPSSDTGN